MKQLIKFFDKLEDRIRYRLSRFPIFYAFLGGIGIVVFWRGVWHSADALMEYWANGQSSDTMSLSGLPWWDGPLSIAVGACLLLISGIFVSNFIGNEIIISGLRGEKKLAEKKPDEIKTETGAIGEIRRDVAKIADELARLNKK